MTSYFTRMDRLYVGLVAFFCVIVVMANLMAVKLFKLPYFGIAIPCGLIIYPFTFMCVDLVSEVFGSARAKFMILSGMAMGLVSFLVIQMALNLPAHPQWVSPSRPFGYSTLDEYEHAFSFVFSLNGLMVFCSLLAYLVSQMLDMSLYIYIKEKTGGRHLWLRNNVSTLVSQFIDTLIVDTLILWWGLQLDLGLVTKIFVVSFLYKAGLTIVGTPLFYVAVSSAKAYIEGKHVQRLAPA